MGEDPNSADPKVGLVLEDRYRIVRMLGQGGMGAVYEGENIRVKRRVAIKCLHPHFAQEPEVVARFHREALAATSVGHPNIIEVTDMGRFDDGTVFIVLEYLEGRDWSDDIAEQGPQPLGKTVRILQQACDALAAAHAKGIVHRDLKPENIYLIERGDERNFVKVLDFGISKVKDAGPSANMTRTGATLGTPYYMSPEQAQGKKDVDHRADIYSLGICLFQALTDQYPFDDDTIHMLILKICTDPAPHLRSFRPDLPEELEDVLTRLLEKDPSDRFQSCEELKAALAPFRDMDDAPQPYEAPRTKDLAPSALRAMSEAETMAAESVAEVSADRVMAAKSSAPNVEPARSSSNKGLLVALGISIAAAFVAVTYSLSGPQAQSNVEIEPSADTTSTPVAPPVLPPEVAPPESVQVRIQTVDAEGNYVSARLTVDGEPVDNPFVGALSLAPHTIEASAAGYTLAHEERDLRTASEGELLPIVLVRRRRGRAAEMTSMALTDTSMDTSMNTAMEPLAEEPPDQVGTMESVVDTPVVTSAMMDIAEMDPAPTMTSMTTTMDLLDIEL